MAEPYRRPARLSGGRAVRDRWERNLKSQLVTLAIAIVTLAVVAIVLMDGLPGL
jgi:hypothetical protein